MVIGPSIMYIVQCWIKARQSITNRKVKNQNISERSERSNHLHPWPTAHGGANPPSRHVAGCRLWLRNWSVLIFFDNFVVICIDNVFSVHGGGVGKYLADWICEGEAPYELNEFDPLRFSPSWTSSWTSSISWPPTKTEILMIIVRASFCHELIEIDPLSTFSWWWWCPEYLP